MEKIRALETPETETPEPADSEEEEPRILDEIAVEELAIDGICGVY
jgi:mycofactocin precursor